ncbi:hypothetical protein J6590_055782 [Homalodisca vitripennis]|nr:hypothetical protein J6590_055782 [Homalodisca vitripennis]
MLVLAYCSSRYHREQPRLTDNLMPRVSTWGACVLDLRTGRERALDFLTMNCARRRLIRALVLMADGCVGAAAPQRMLGLLDRIVLWGINSVSLVVCFQRHSVHSVPLSLYTRPRILLLALYLLGTTSRHWPLPYSPSVGTLQF